MWYSAAIAASIRNAPSTTAGSRVRARLTWSANARSDRGSASSPMNARSLTAPSTSASNSSVGIAVLSGKAAAANPSGFFSQRCSTSFNCWRIRRTTAMRAAASAAPRGDARRRSRRLPRALQGQRGAGAVDDQRRIADQPAPGALDRQRVRQIAEVPGPDAGALELGPGGGKTELGRFAELSPQLGEITALRELLARRVDDAHIDAQVRRKL